MKLQDLLNGQDGIGLPQAERVRYAFAYLRVSKDVQDEEAQREDIEKYAAANSIVIVRWYRDHASRANDDASREDFWRMVEDAKADRAVSLILVREDSRFYRKRRKAGKVKSELARFGVHVIAVTTPYDPTTVGGLWQESINETQPEAYSMQVRDYTMVNMRYNAERRDPETGWCFKNGGWALWGYNKVAVFRGTDRYGNPKRKQLWLLEDEIVVGKPKWQWVRTILLDWYVEKGWGDDKICTELNRLGVKPTYKDYWNKSAFGYMRSPIALLTYAGWYIWGKHKQKDLGEPLTKVEMRPPSEWKKVPNAHPAILTMEEAEKIAAEVERRKRTFGGSWCRSHKSVYLLTGGLGKCKRCGGNLVGFHVNRRGYDTRYYVCSNWYYRRGGPCDSAFTVRMESLDGRLIERIQQRYLWAEAEDINGRLEEQDFVEITRMVNTMRMERHQQAFGSVDMIEKELRRIERETQNLLNSIKAGVPAELVAQEAQRLAQRKAELERQRAVMNVVKPKQITLAEVRERLTNVQVLLERGTPEQRRQLVRDFVAEVRLDPDKGRAEVDFYRWGVCNLMVAPQGVEIPAHFFECALLPLHVAFVRKRCWHVACGAA